MQIELKPSNEHCNTEFTSFCASICYENGKNKKCYLIWARCCSSYFFFFSISFFAIFSLFSFIFSDIQMKCNIQHSLADEYHKIVNFFLSFKRCLSSSFFFAVLLRFFFCHLQFNLRRIQCTQGFTVFFWMFPTFLWIYSFGFFENIFHFYCCEFFDTIDSDISVCIFFFLLSCLCSSHFHST